MFVRPALLSAAALAFAAGNAAAQEARSSSSMASSGMQSNPAASPVCSSSAMCTGSATASFTADGSSSPSGTIEVASWSFGASNPTSVGSSGMSAGRVSAPRDAASGLATGKRQHQPVTVSKVAISDLSVMKRTAMCGTASVCESPSSLTFTSKGGGPRCVQGTHFPTVVLTAGRSSAQLTDVTVSSCDAATSSVSLNFAKIEWK